MPDTSPNPGLSTLRASQDRAFDREGIPMVLALVSEVGPMPPVSDELALRDGQRLAASMDTYREALIPTGRDTDMGCLISVLQAVSYDDFGRSA